MPNKRQRMRTELRTFSIGDVNDTGTYRFIRNGT